MSNIAEGEPGSSELMLGNEAIARGALEAGVQVCTGYPGTPSTEIVQSLIDSAKGQEMHVEWSINEKVAVEVVAAAAFAGLRSLAVMKNAGANVAMDALMRLSLRGFSETILPTCKKVKVGKQSFRWNFHAGCLNNLTTNQAVLEPMSPFHDHIQLNGKIQNLI